MMLKRRKFPCPHKQHDSSESEDNAPIETPPNDTKLRLLLSGFPHDGRFIFKMIVSKYHIASPRNENDLSLQPHHERFRPDISPHIFRANRAMLEQSPERQQDPSIILKTTATSISPNRRRGRLLNPGVLPAQPNQVQKPKNKKLRDLVRRKSCHCYDCGGLSKIEKETMHLPPEPRKSRIMQPPINILAPKVVTNTPKNTQRPPTKNKNFGRRGSVATFLPSKGPDNDDFLNVPLSDLPTRTRNKTYDVSKTVDPESLGSIEKNDEKKRSGIFLDRRFDSSPGRKVSGKHSERSLDKSLVSSKHEKLGKSTSTKESSPKKSGSAKLKKIQIKRSTSVISRGAQLAPYADLSMKVYNSEVRPSFSQDSLKKNFSSERGNKETTQRSTLSTTASKDVLALKNVLSTGSKSSKPIRVVPTEKISKVSPFCLSLSKIQRKHNSQSLSEQRSLSLPKLPKDTSVIVQNDAKVSEGVKGQKSRENVDIKNIVPVLKIRNRSQIGMHTYRSETQTSREVMMNKTKGDTTNESFINNIRASVEKDKSAEKPKKKKKGNQIPNPMWKNYMQTAFLAYKETARKTKGLFGSQSYRGNLDLH